MRKARGIAVVALVGAAAVLLSVFAGAGSAHSTKKPTGKPIIIGAAIDLTKNMAPFDAPALTAAQIEIKKINAAGGVLGRPLKLDFVNDQLDPQATKQAAVGLLQKKADIGWVTCDVDYATPAAQEFLNAGKLTVAPCLGTDELSPVRFGSKGRLAFSFGNAAQDEGAAMAEWAYKVKKWRSAVVVTDNLLRYFKDVCQAFSVRYQQLGGKIVSQESFTQGDKTINNVVSRVNGEKSQMIAFCTSFAGDQPAFVAGLRTLKNNTPIMNSWAGDGAYWWTKSPPVTNFYYVTYASVFGDDPSKQVRAFEKLMAKAGHPAQTGGFITGAATVQALADAIRTAKSTNGAKLAAVLVKFHKHPTISGNISFSAGLHSVFGRQYRVIAVNDNKAKVVGKVTATSPAKIH
ncbi:MAG TPA: ABC transporter substrate-binding protein [Gaiellaceae bacterium]|jgi:branched-chain amino acid transport system substrate-binding protein